VGVSVPPRQVAADHGGLLVVAFVVGAVQGEGAQRGDLGLDPVPPGSVGGHIGQLEVVGRCPVADAGVVGGRQVGLRLSSTIPTRTVSGYRVLR
jgi:hypothetical protein